MEHLQTVQQIFSDKLFKVPDYQRGYAWDETQWIDLIEDLKLLQEEQEHYTGTLVLYHDETKEHITDEEGKKLDIYDIVDGQQRLATIVILLHCISNEPQKHFINHCIRIGRFKTETTIIDDKWMKGNLFKQFEETENMLKQHMSVRYEIKDFFRKDIWDYPIEALREAVLNAIVHRDYFDVANFALIKVYDDHIWITNPGGLPEGITIEELTRPHKSRLRNPLIAKAFYLSGLIEQYGSGTVRMIDWMKEAGLPEPVYKEEQAGFSVYFYKDIYTEENLIKMGLNDRQIKSVMYVKAKGRITNKEYQSQLSVSKPTATRDLAEMVEKQILVLKGSGKRDIHYILREPKMSQKINE